MSADRAELYGFVTRAAHDNRAEEPDPEHEFFRDSQGRLCRNGTTIQDPRWRAMFPSLLSKPEAR